MMGLSAGLPEMVQLRRAAISLDFMAGVLDPRLSFSRASSKYVFDATGQLVERTANTPAFEWDPTTLQSRGLLLEPQRAQKLATLVMTAAPWSATATMSVTPVSAPFSGPGSAYRLTATGASDSWIHHADAFSAGAQQTVSLWWRGVGAAAGKTVAIGNYNGGTRQQVNAVVPAGWTRFTLTVTPSAASARHLYINLTQNTAGGEGITANLGVGDSIEVYWPQVEDGPTASSPMLAGVTRAADLCWAPLSALGSGTPQTGTMAVEGTVLGYRSGAYQGVAVLDDDTNSNIIALRLNGTAGALSYGVSVGDAAQAGHDLPAVSVGGDFKMAVAWAPNDFTFAANGSVRNTDTVGSVPATSTLRIGRTAVDTGMHGYVRSLRLWPWRMQDTTLAGGT